MDRYTQRVPRRVADIIIRLEVIPAQSAYHCRLTLLYPLLSSTVPTPPIHTSDVVVVPV